MSNEVSPKFKRSFKGIVHLKEWIKLSNGRTYAGFVGWVTILTAQEAIGIVPADRESNWVALVHQSEVFDDASDFFVILGCQVRGFERNAADYEISGEFARIGSLR